MSILLHLDGAEMEAWLTAVLIGVGALLAQVVGVRLLARQLAALARHTATELDDFLASLLRKTSFLFMLAVAVYAATLALSLPPRLGLLVWHVLILAILVQAALWSNDLIIWYITRAIKKRVETDASSAATLSVLGFVGRVAIWAVVILAALDNFGFNISTLLAGLGIGGVAAALAAQNVLSDLFASISIALDKPFVVGDFIIVGDHMGTVEHVGVKTTRLRSLSGEQVIFSNGDLLKSRIHNYKRMYERRIVFHVGVVYRTPAEQIEAIPGMLKEIVTARPKVRFDRAHFSEMGDSALIFEVVYYVTDPDYTLYMDTQQAINLAIVRRFQREGIDFAYPTQTLYLEKA